MTLTIPDKLLEDIYHHGEVAYPDEGAGLLLGEMDGTARKVSFVLSLANAREGKDRRNRYLITPQDFLRGEKEAAARGIDVLGVFHSHPDHPDRPSDFDRQWALPWFSYLITSVVDGQATHSRSWRLTDDRESFEEEPLRVIDT